MALIVAAGSGERLGVGSRTVVEPVSDDRPVRRVPKALVECAGRPLIGWCLEAFDAARSVGAAVIAAPPGEKTGVAAAAAAYAPDLAIDVVTGGSARSLSVRAALRRADERFGQARVVVVHDAARPLVTAALIDGCVAALVARDDVAGVIAAAPVTDTIKRAEPDGAVIETIDRRGLWAIQTPQAFDRSALRDALAGSDRRLIAATDDAALVELQGAAVEVYPAPRGNFKVTTADDLARAAAALPARHA